MEAWTPQWLFSMLEVGDANLALDLWNISRMVSTTPKPNQGLMGYTATKSHCMEDMFCFFARVVGGNHARISPVLGPRYGNAENVRKVPVAISLFVHCSQEEILTYDSVPQPYIPVQLEIYTYSYRYVRVI